MALQRLTNDVHNAASGTISGTVLSGATTCTLATGSSLIGTETPFMMAVWDTSYESAALAFLNGKYELVSVSSISGSTINTMARGQEGTTATDWDTTGGAVWQWDVVITEAMWREIDTFIDNALDQSLAYQFNVKTTTYGAVGDVPDSPSAAQLSAATDDTAAFQAAVTAAEANPGGGQVLVPEGGYKLDKVTLDASKVSVFGVFGAKVYQKAAGAEVFEVLDTDDILFDGLEVIGVGGDGETTTQFDQGIRCKSTAGTPAIGDLNRITVRNCVFRDFRFHGCSMEHVDVARIQNCDVIGCRDAMAFYGCRDAEMNSCHTDTSMAAETWTTLSGTFGCFMGSSNAVNSENVRFVNCTVRSRDNQQGFLIHSGVGVTVQGCDVIDSVMGIYVVPAAAETNAIVSDVLIDNCRVLLRTTSGSAGASPGNYGIIVGGNSAATVTHTERVVISDCTVTGGNVSLDNKGEGGICLSSYTRDAKIVDCDVDNCSGYGIGLNGSNHDDFRIEDCNIRDVAVSGASGGDNGQAIALRNTVGSTSSGVIRGCTFDDCNEGIRTSEAASDVNVYDITFRTITAGAGSYVIGTFNEDLPAIRGNLSVTGTSTLTGAVSAPGGVTGDLTGDVAGDLTGNVTGGNSNYLEIGDCRLDRGAANKWHTDDDVDIDGALEVAGTATLDGATTVNGDVVFEGDVQYGAPESLTVASAAITVTKSYATVAGEGAAADTLSTINGGQDGMRLILRRNTDNITIDQAGNILLDSASNCVLNNDQHRIELLYDAGLSKWVELTRQD